MWRAGLLEPGREPLLEAQEAPVTKACGHPRLHAGGSPHFRVDSIGFYSGPLSVEKDS